MDDTDSILLWEEDAVHQFLTSLGFKGYEQQIKEHGITGEILVHLDHQALKDVGIHSVGHRLAILKAVYQLKLLHDVPIEEGHWVPPSEFMDQIMVDSPSGVIPPDRMFELLKERDDRIRNLEVALSRLSDSMSGVRDEVHVISKTLYTKEPPVSLNKLRANSPTTGTFLNSSLRHMRSGSIPRENGQADGASPATSPVNSPTRLTHLREDISSTVLGEGPGATHLQHSSSIRRQRSNHGLLTATSALQEVTTPTTATPYSPIPNHMILPNQSSQFNEPPTPTANQLPHSAATTPAHEISAPLETPALATGTTSNTSPASRLLNEGLGKTSAGSLPGTSDRRPGTSGEASSSTAGKEVSAAKSSSSSADSLTKSFRVTLDDPCFKVLPAALKKYKINDDWRQYALFICYGSHERCLSYDEKPLLFFQKLKETNQNPVFMLKHIKDIKSPIAVAHTKHAARREKRAKEGKNITGEGKEGPIRDFSRATRLHHPAVLQPVKGGPNSPSLPGKDSEADGKDGKGSDGKEAANAGAGYALAIYPYMADREDEFDVAVGDTFVILNKTKGWWVVHRDSQSDNDSDIVRSGWVPQGCLLETSVPPAKTGNTSMSSSSPINPLSIVSVSTPGLALMDYTPRGSDEISMKKDDKLRVFKRYNHWSYVIKEQTGERGWTPSWFVGKVSSSSGSGSAQSTPTSAATSSLATAVPPLTSGMPPMSASSMYGTHPASTLRNGETTPTSAQMSSGTSAQD